jgi:hypothetical protein
VPDLDNERGIPAQRGRSGSDAYHQRADWSPFVVFQPPFSQMHDDGVKEINPDFDALLVFLANWEAIERSALGRILTAGQLADVQELERLYALPSEPTEHLSE